MRTDSQNNMLKSEMPVSEVNSCSAEPKETLKSTRKSLHPLQVAAGDKENLVGAGRMPVVVSEKEPKVAVTINSKLSSGFNSPKKDKKKSHKNQEKKSITAEDLTSEDGPSEHYWEVLAETRRKALEKTLEENQQLHERLEKLIEENKKYKDLLNEAQAIIDTLNEVIAEINDDDSEIVEDVIRRP